MKEFKTATAKPYDYDSADDVFCVLFTQGLDREDGLKEIPAASLQLVVSALEYIRYELKPGISKTYMNEVIYQCERLRDAQKKREWKRKIEEEN